MELNYFVEKYKYKGKTYLSAKAKTRQFPEFYSEGFEDTPENEKKALSQIKEMVKKENPRINLIPHKDILTP